MARKHKTLDDAEEAAPQHLSDEYADNYEAAAPLNSAARSEIIREAHETISEYERQVAGIKAEIKAVVETRIVAGLGMKKSDFALARKLVDLDEGVRDGLFDTIRETFNALDVGEQSSFLDAYAQQAQQAGDAA